MPDQFDFSDLTDDQLIDLYIHFERQRHALQTEIGRRNIGDKVDEAAGRYFQVGRITGTYDRENMMFDLDVEVDSDILAGLDDLEL